MSALSTQWSPLVDTFYHFGDPLDIAMSGLSLGGRGDDSKSPSQPVSKWAARLFGLVPNEWFMGVDSIMAPGANELILFYDALSKTFVSLLSTHEELMEDLFEVVARQNFGHVWHEYMEVPVRAFFKQSVNALNKLKAEEQRSAKAVSNMLDCFSMRGKFGIEQGAAIMKSYFSRLGRPSERLYMCALNLYLELLPLAAINNGSSSTLDSRHFVRYMKFALRSTGCWSDELVDPILVWHMAARSHPPQELQAVQLSIKGEMTTTKPLTKTKSYTSSFFEPQHDDGLSSQSSASSSSPLSAPPVLSKAPISSSAPPASGGLRGKKQRRAVSEDPWGGAAAAVDGDDADADASSNAALVVRDAKGLLNEAWLGLLLYSLHEFTLPESEDLPHEHYSQRNLNDCGTSLKPQRGGGPFDSATRGFGTALGDGRLGTRLGQATRFVAESVFAVLGYLEKIVVPQEESADPVDVQDEELYNRLAFGLCQVRALSNEVSSQIAKEIANRKLPVGLQKHQCVLNFKNELQAAVNALETFKYSYPKKALNILAADPHTLPDDVTRLFALAPHIIVPSSGAEHRRSVGNLTKLVRAVKDVFMLKSMMHSKAERDYRQHQIWGDTDVGGTGDDTGDFEGDFEGDDDDEMIMAMMMEDIEGDEDDVEL